MGKYFITGNAGTGKSTVVKILKHRGYSAFDVDERPDIHGYLDVQTNTITDYLPKTELTGTQAFARYHSILKESGLRELLQKSGNIFLAGSVTNQNQFYVLFTKIFGLVLSTDILEDRLATRTNNPTGSDPADRAYLASINDRSRANLQAADAILIDASQPPEKVADEILHYAQDN